MAEERELILKLGKKITDRIPLDPHGPIVFVESICFKNDGENLGWSR